jgi:sialate O-acetylesterase
MMLQRSQPVRVWGWAQPDETVIVSLAGHQAPAKADAKGAWAVELPAMREGENLVLTVTGKNTITLTNVIVGDIWLCGGQSNMEMALSDFGGCLNAEEDIKTAGIPRIRRLKVNHGVAIAPEYDAPTAGPWQVCSPQTVARFTAAGFYFAREIFQKTGVPIGLIDDNWSGTMIEPWISPYALETTPERNSMYHAMINPLVRFPIKGVIWYQGESNGGEGEPYYHKMRALVNGWRQAWNQSPPVGAGASIGDFPFYFVQLASFQNPNSNPAGGDGWAWLREAQLRSLAITNTGMAVTIDTVPARASGDIHPKNKYDVGLRLARWALNRDYGMKDMIPSGPLFKSMSVEGAKVRLTFDFTGSGLMVGAKEGRAPVIEDAGGRLNGFAIAGVDPSAPTNAPTGGLKWFWADAVIDGPTVVASSPEVKAPLAVRYAFSMNPIGANLYNREGLPASPFRTDTR